MTDKANKHSFILKPSTIAKIEAGSTPNPTIDTLTKIAKAFEVGVNDLKKIYERI